MSAFQPAKRRRPSQQRSNLWVLLISFLIVIGIGGVILWISMSFGKDQSNDKENISEPISTEQAMVDEDNSKDLVEKPNSETMPETNESTAGDEVVAPEEEKLEDAEEETIEGPLEIVRPEIEQMKEFVPDGGTFNRYWWNNMNDDDYDEVLVGYIKEGEVHVMNLGVKDDTVGYESTFDVVVPGKGIDSLTSARAGDGFVVQVVTSYEDSNMFSLYQYSNEELQTYPLVGGDFDGQKTEITYARLSTSPTPSSVSYENGKIIINVLADESEEAEDGTKTFNRTTYELQEGEFIFSTTETITEADAKDAE